MLRVDHVIEPGRAAHGPTLELLILALPMIGVSVSRMLINFVDFWMVSMLGTAAQAAISPSTILLYAVSCIGMGMSQSIQTFVSQADGRGEPQKTGAYAWQSIYIALATAIVTAPVVVLTPTWMGWVGRVGHHSAEMLDNEIRFLQIALWSVAPATACMGLESFYNGIRRPRVNLAAVLVSLVTIVVANYALIFGHFGFPAMGIAGSGVATVLAWTIRLIVLAAPLLLSGRMDQRYRTRRSFAPDPAKLRQIVGIGWPISAQWLVDIGAWVLFLELMLPQFGDHTLAAGNIAIQCMHLCFMPALGIGMALTSQVGFAIGEGKPDLAVMRVRIARRLTLAYMGGLGLLLLTLREPTLRLFTSDADVVAAGMTILIWVALFQLSDALCIVYSFALRGAGDTRVSAVLFVICCWGIFVLGGGALAWFWPHVFGLNGPWGMCTLYIVVLGFLLMRRFHSGKWRSIRLFDAKDKPSPEPARTTSGGAAQPAAPLGSELPSAPV